MNRRIGLALIAALGMLSWTTSAQAQAPGVYPPNYGPGYRPQLSPYLYLAPGGGLNGVGGGDPGLRYYLGTQTEMDRRQNYAQTRSTFRDIEGDIATRRGGAMGPDDDLYRPLASSGHPTTFGNTGMYFGAGYPNINRQGLVGQRGPNGGPPTQGTQQNQSGRRQ